MSKITAFHILPAATSWAEVKRVTLQSRLSDEGQPKYRFSMYSLLSCEEIETLQYKTSLGRIRHTCAFLICDESFSMKQSDENLLLKGIGITIKGSVLLVGGKRLEQNKYLFYFDSLPDDYLDTSAKISSVVTNLCCGWVMRNSSVPLPKELTQVAASQIFTPQEYAIEWHEQHKIVQQQVLAQFLQGADLSNQNLMMITDAGCSGCGKLDAQMKRCGACKVTRYCSQDCQKQDRRSHIAFCNKVASS